MSDREALHIIFAAIMASYFAANAFIEFRRRNTGMGWYYNFFGLLCTAYLWLLISEAR